MNSLAQKLEDRGVFPVFTALIVFTNTDIPLFLKELDENEARLMEHDREIWIR